MPEGDTIHRAARTLHRALAGRRITQFESPLPALTRVDEDRGLVGRTIERVAANGKHLLLYLEDDLVLHTHMRMNGSWHIYRPGERWQRSATDMRVLIATDEYVAVGFNIPVAEFHTSRTLARSRLKDIGPDLLSEAFDKSDATLRLRARAQVEVADALLDQRAVAGIGNIYKSEILFMCGILPFRRIADLSDDELQSILDTARRVMSANLAPGSPAAIVTYRTLRRATRRADPSGSVWVNGRTAKPCRKCGTPIARRQQGDDARATYWCRQCQK
jgi:endonuclease-8